MQFGLFFINERAPGVSDAEVTKDALEQCRLADEVGFDAVWLGEHHFSPYGTMPDTMVFAGAVSQVTKRVNIGTAVIVPTFQHPVRVAEQVSMLDHLSDGRFWLGVGRGYQQREFNGFGIPQSESKNRFRESVTIIRGLLRNETFSYEGEYWSVDDLGITPKPIREVPIYVAVSRTPESFEWAVEEDFGVLVGNPYSIDSGNEDAQEMHTAAQRAAGRPESSARTWATLNNVFLHESSQKAKDIFEETWKIGNEYLWKYARVVEEGQEVPDDYKHYAGWKDLINTQEYQSLAASPSTMVGSPNEVVERLERLTELSPGIDKYILWMNRGGSIPQREVLESIELFGTKVLPQVRDLGSAAPSA